MRSTPAVRTLKKATSYVEPSYQAGESRLVLHEEPVPVIVQLAKLQSLRQALQLVGVAAKGARQWSVVSACKFFKAAVGSIPVGWSAVTSSSVRLNSKVDISARRKRR